METDRRAHGRRIRVLGAWVQLRCYRYPLYGTRCIPVPGVWYPVPGTGIHIHLLQFHFYLKRGGLLTNPYKNNFTFNAVHKISDFGFHSYLKWGFRPYRKVIRHNPRAILRFISPARIVSEI